MKLAPNVSPSGLESAADPVTSHRSATGPAQAFLRSQILRRLDSLRFGQIEIRDGDDSWLVGEAHEGSPVARMEVRDPRVYRSLAFSGTLGGAESWMDGWWTSEDLVSLLRLFARNVAAGTAGRWVTPRFVEPVARVAHHFRRNTREGSRRNIHDHYDLGNDLFRLFLDETMTYSCGVFEDEASTLRDASIAKLDRVCRKLGIGPEHWVVEIGTGWGSFAIHAAGKYGCRVTTTTISREQCDEARRRVHEAGLSEKVEVLLRDYRDLDGTYDRLVSIEMIEAVGHENLDGFFAACDRLLADDGAALIQAITMPDRDHAAYLRSVDFIQRYIFPGSCLSSLGSLTSSIGRATSLRVEQVEDIGLHYAPTLAEWRRRFSEQADAIRALGRSERFLRLWEYYFAYCEAGFAEKYLGDLQVLLAKPGARLDPVQLAPQPCRKGDPS